MLTDNDWNRLRNEKGDIDIVAAYIEHNAGKNVVFGKAYLESLAQLQPIKSRQAAAIAWVTAASFDTLMEDLSNGNT